MDLALDGDARGPGLPHRSPAADLRRCGPARLSGRRHGVRLSARRDPAAGGTAPAADLPSVAPERFTGALAAAANGVSVVTTAAGGRRAGLTVSSMCSVCADPPLLLACVNLDNEFDDLAARAGTFAVNILESRHAELAAVFAGLVEPSRRADGPVAERFDTGDWGALATGAPTLADALVSLDCTLDSSLERGTHRIWIGRVVALATSPGVPLVYTSRAFATTRTLDRG